MRLAVITSHPVQYYAPLFRALAERVDLTVFYGYRPDPADQAQAGFGVGFDWDIDLTSGYRSEFLDNRARRPGLAGFWGISTPGIGRQLRAGSFDAVLLIGWHKKFLLQALLSAKRIGLPVLMRGDSHLQTPRSALKRIAKEIAYPLFLRQFDAALAVGLLNQAYWRHYRYPAARLFSSPHCVDTAWFAARATPAARLDLRAQLGIDPGAPVVLFAGKLVELKQPLQLVEAVSKVHRSGAPAELLIAGDGPLRQAIEDRAAALGLRLHLLGFCNQSRMPAAYAAADVLALPSQEESWGLVANEALACGTPVVVADSVGCAPDLAEVFGDRIIFAYGRVDSLIDRLQAVLHSRPSAESMAAANRRFSLSAAADGVLAALTSLTKISVGGDDRG